MSVTHQGLASIRLPVRLFLALCSMSSPLDPVFIIPFAEKSRHREVDFPRNFKWMSIPSSESRIRCTAGPTVYADRSARSREATFVPSSPLQLRPTYAIEGSAKRSESVRLPNMPEHLSRDSHVIRGLVR